MSRCWTKGTAVYASAGCRDRRTLHPGRCLRHGSICAPNSGPQAYHSPPSRQGRASTQNHLPLDLTSTAAKLPIKLTAVNKILALSSLHLYTLSTQRKALESLVYILLHVITTTKAIPTTSVLSLNCRRASNSPIFLPLVSNAFLANTPLSLLLYHCGHHINDNFRDH